MLTSYLIDLGQGKGNYTVLQPAHKHQTKGEAL